MRKAGFSLAACALALPVAAQAMSVDDFLAKAKKLQAAGLGAMVSPDLPLVKNEIMTASDAYRGDIAAAQKAGNKPRSCPPPKGQAKVDSKDLMNAFAALPPAERRQSVTVAFGRFMDRRFPCH